MGYALENLGYCKLLQEKYDEGLRLIHRSLNFIHDRYALAEAYVDLCYGYLGKNELERSRMYGQKALDLAEEERQIRNTHYLLGEIAHQMHDTEKAEFHFNELARFYPGFRHLKDVLFAIDLRRMRFTLFCVMAARLPRIIDSAAITPSTLFQSRAKSCTPV